MDLLSAWGSSPGEYFVFWYAREQIQSSVNKSAQKCAVPSFSVRDHCARCIALKSPILHIYFLRPIASVGCLPFC